MKRQEIVLNIFSLAIALTLIYGVALMWKAKESPKVPKAKVNVEVVQQKGTPVVATMYNAVPQQCNSDPSHTAFMFKLDLQNPYKHRIIAVSRDLLVEYPKGTRVRVEGTDYDGVWIVMDKMNKRFKNKIDLLINVGMKGNKWTNVKIYKVD